MSLKNLIDQDFLSAYKAKDEQLVSVLRGIKSSIKNTEINEKRELSDEDVEKVLKKEVKQRLDSISEYTKGNRPDLAEKEKAEAEIIKKYLPEQLSQEATQALVEKAILQLSATGIADMGKVIGFVMKETSGADGGLVSKIAKELLSQKQNG